MNSNKLSDLINNLVDMKSAILAFSGGVDSTLLLKAISMSGINSLAVTASSEIIPAGEVREATEIAKALGIKHRVLETGPLKEDFLSNTADRCFICKTYLFEALSEIARAEGCNFVLDGSNVDDSRDHRPGRKAALRYGVRSPLAESDLSKKEIRELSKDLGLATWEKPSSPCLATRIPCGTRITSEALTRIGLSEDFLRSMGFRQIRVRDHGSIARIEVGCDELDTLMKREKREIVSRKLRSFGYEFVSLDLEGYRSGSMDRIPKNGH